MRINLLLLAAGIVIGVLLARLAGCNNTADCPEATVINGTIPVKDSTAWYKPAPQVVQQEATDKKWERGVAQILPSDLPGYYKPKAHKVTPDVSNTDSSAYTWWKKDRDSFIYTFPHPVPPETVYYNDTARTKFGNVIIQDTLQDNRIKARRVLTELSIPTVYKTITVREPLRNKLYLGINAYGSDVQGVLGVGPSILLETKRGKAFEVGTYFTRSELLYHAGVKFNLLHQ